MDRDGIFVSWHILPTVAIVGCFRAHAHRGMAAERQGQDGVAVVRGKVAATMNTLNPSTAYPGIESFPCFVVGQHSVKRQRRAQANREARNRGWVAEWRTLGADPLEDRAVRIEREPPEMHSWVVRQTSDNVRGALR